MKSILLRSLAVSALVCGLASCGGSGGDDDYEIKGVISGEDSTIKPVTYPDLQLKNGADIIDVPAGDSTFKFPTKLSYGDLYNVSVARNPKHQTCTVVAPSLDGVNGRDSAGRLTEINVVVQCVIQKHLVVVDTPKPLVGLTLTNGSLSARPVLTGTEKNVAFEVYFGDSYGITILQQPTTGGPCRIENGTGIMGDENRTDAKLVCP